MTKKPSIDWVVKNGLCLGCGVCEDTCTLGAIHFIEKNALNIPQIDPTLCINKKTNCSRCFDVCPGHGIDLNNRSKRLFGQSNRSDPYIGPYTSCYTGWSQDDNIRYHSASGGMLSHFLIYLLDRKAIDGAVVTRFSKTNPLRTESFIATSRDEILSAKSSKYCPVSLNGIVRKVVSFPGKVAIVGLPCHIHGMKKTEDYNKSFRNKVVAYFAIFCSSNRNYKAIDFLLKRHKVPPSSVKEFSFRDEGCLGSLRIVTDSKTFAEPYQSYYSTLRSYFKPKRCAFCLDHYGMLADVSFGDIHLAPYFNKVGVNSIIVRNPFFEKLLNQANDEEKILIKEAPCEDVNRSQQMMLKNRNISAPFFYKFEKLLGKKTPEHDLQIPNPNLMKGARYWFSYAIQRAIGRWLY